jgi:hypothetical protein
VELTRQFEELKRAPRLDLMAIECVVDNVYKVRQFAAYVHCHMRRRQWL